MNILYLSTLYPPAIGGAQIHLHCLATRMRALGHRVNVFTCAGRNRDDWLRLSTVCPEPRKDYVIDGVPVSQLGYSGTARMRILPWMAAYYFAVGPCARQLARRIGGQVPWPSKSPSVVHVSRIGREFLAGAALDFARNRGVPFVLTPNHHPRWDGWRYVEYDRIYREADALFALTPAEKSTLVEQKNVPPERVHVTGIGPVLSEHFFVDEFRAKHDIHGRFVLYLGQQLRYKGVGALREAASIVWQKDPDVRFVFIGPQTDYSQRLFSGACDKRLINLGSVDLETKTAALAACEFLCLPSMQESFGGVFVEAWSMRKAVIGGRIAPIADVIDEGRNGLLSSQDPDELAAAIGTMLSDEARTKEMGQAGFAKVQARYSWERIAEQTLTVYRSLIAAGTVREREFASVEDSDAETPAVAASASV